MTQRNQTTDATRWLRDEIDDVSARGIRHRMTELIRSGYLHVGAPLPTVRDIARELGVSVGSVADAWAQLRADKLIVTRRRGGTIVATGETAKSGAMPVASSRWYSVDLAQGTAEPNLQPHLGKALLASLQSATLNAPDSEAISNALVAAARPTFPFKPDAWTASGGGTEGALLAFEAVSKRGCVVAIEEPTSPRILDAFKALGIQLIGVPCDREGPLPDGLKSALRYNPSAFVYQPRAQVPLGHRVSDRRIKELADVISNHDDRVAVVEDDNIGPIATADVSSMGSYLPDRVLYVRAYCKTYGVDLRTSIIAGSAELVERARQMRSHGTAMTSRILQEAVAYLITDPETESIIDRARLCYAQRRQRLREALNLRGMPTDEGDGFVLWLPVADENATLLNLASFGVSVGAGSKCFVTPQSAGHLRIATSRLPDDYQSVEQLADIIEKAVAGRARVEYE
ncbi:aminotransferase-like domain-containing protein [Paraburkholderia sp. RL17-347-BIC-D]|uniref:aminotransferase-like domain-containing protein n=1 Tax=Paraburkholderia sp. RL17-347-BIC-D TaxID=3031632 RepID=UPI0038B85B97